MAARSAIWRVVDPANPFVEKHSNAEINNLRELSD